MCEERPGRGSAVEIESSGEIVAEGFRLEEGGLRVHFTGKAELLLYPAAEGFPQ